VRLSRNGACSLGQERSRSATKLLDFLENPSRKTKKLSRSDGVREARKGAPTNRAGTPMREYLTEHAVIAKPFYCDF
jgi:hypothetical protein